MQCTNKMASFPSSFDPERSCRICLYVGKTRSQLSNQNNYWHKDVLFSNKYEFSAYHRRPVGDTPRCEHCGIFIVFIFFTEHKSNVLHLFSVAKAQNHQPKIVHTEPKPFVEGFRCFPRNGVSGDGLSQKTRHCACSLWCYYLRLSWA